MSAKPQAVRRRTILVAHPSPDLYGSDRVLLETVSALADGATDVVVTLPADGPLVPLLRERGARVVLLPTLVLQKRLLSPRGLVTLLGRGTHTVLRAIGLTRRLRPDLVVVNTMTIPGWVLAGRLAGTRVLCHVHEAERGAHSLVRAALAAPLLLGNRIVTNSEFSRETLASSLPGLRGRSTVVYNGVPGPAAPAAPRAALDGGPSLVYVGRLSPRKGVDVAIEAVAIARERGIPATLTVVGDVFPGYEWFATQLHDAVAEHGLGDAVRFAGFRSDVWSALEDADIAVVPSVADEPFGNTAVEAVLARRPAIVSDTSGLREAGGVFPSVTLAAPGDPGAIAEALSAVVDEWAELVTMTDPARHDAQRRYGVPAYRAAFAREVDALTPNRTNV